MSRGLWFVAGAGAGIYAVVRGRRVAEALTVDGLTDRLNGLAVGARMFRDEVAQGHAEKQSELRERIAVAGRRAAALPATGSTAAPTTAVPPAPPIPETPAQEEGSSR